MEYNVALVVGIGLDKLIEFDAVGRNQRIFNSVSKEASATQKIEFEKNPSEDEVTSFLYYTAD